MHINRHGLREHYRGLTAVLLRNGPANMLFFGLRDPIRTFLPSATSSTSKLLNDFFSGALLGAAISTITYPINGTLNPFPRDRISDLLFVCSGSNEDAKCVWRSLYWTL